MSRVVIVARTRMQHDHVCIGGHDLDRGFRGVRLLDKFGAHWTSDSPFNVGDVWEMRYIEKVSARPPHVEDAFVMEFRRVGHVRDLKAMVLRCIQPWCGPPDALFHGTVRATASGGAYIPEHGRLPRCSTGYWQPDEPLVRQGVNGRTRFMLSGDSGITRLTWVGVQEPPERIEAGSLVRVSLSRLFVWESAPAGYYVQLSGVLLDPEVVGPTGFEPVSPP